MSEDTKKLGELLKRQQKQRKRMKGLKAAMRQTALALNKLKGKIAATRARIEAAKNPGKKAVAWAMSQQGVAEKPDGSNWGVPVQNWIKRTGYTFPVPWCGCFVHEAVKVRAGANIPTGIRLGYNEYIVQDAEAGRNGLREVPYGAARPGDIVVFTFPHIALVRGNPSTTILPTVEGNTSPTSTGSQANGGTVAAKSRPRGVVRLIARPDYQ